MMMAGSSGLASSARFEVVSLAPEAVEQLANFVHAAAGSAGACSTWTEVLDLVSASAAALFKSNVSDEDVVSCFALALNEVRKGGSLDSKRVAQLVSALAAGPRPAARFHVLCALFGHVSTSSDKMAVLSAVVAASPGVDRETVDAAMDDMVRSSLDDLEEGLDASGRRTLHFALYEAFQASPSEEKQKSAQVFALKYLKSFAGESMPPSAVGLAQKTAVAALKDPFTWFRDRADLLAIPPLAALARSEEADDVALHALLVVFATLSYAQFAPLASKHAALFKKKGLVVADLETKMRLVSLCALAAESDAVPYAAVASALQVELAEVEAWVVKAITADLVECKMDQLQKVVCVSRCCLFRSTGLEDWLSVQQQLVHWKANIEKLRDTLARARTAVA